jgi:hypothetical protein
MVSGIHRGGFCYDLICVLNPEILSDAPGFVTNDSIAVTTG